MNLALMVVLMIVLVVGVFSVLMLFMRKIMKEDVVSATAHLDQQREEHARKEAELNKKLEEIKRQGQEIVTNAQKEAEQRKEEALKAAQAEKDKIVAAAHANADEVIRQADKARLALLADMENKVLEKAVVKAVELLQQALPADLRVQMHRSWTENLIQASFEQLDRLKIPEDVTAAKVVGAFALQPQERQALEEKIAEKLGRRIQLQEETDPALIAGLVVSMGSLFLDGSVRFKIQEAARGQR